jgi:hypothetical protein
MKYDTSSEQTGTASPLPTNFIYFVEWAYKNVFWVLYGRAVSNEVKLTPDETNGRTVLELAEHQTSAPPTVYYILHLTEQQFNVKEAWTVSILYRVSPAEASSEISPRGRKCPVREPKCKKDRWGLKPLEHWSR